MSRIFGGRRTLVGPESDTHLASGNQCFGSGSRLDQDSDWIRIQGVFWIRIPNPNTGSGSRGVKKAKIVK